MHHTLADLSAIGRAMQNRWPMSHGALRTVEAELVATLANPATIGARRQRAAQSLTLIRKRISELQSPPPTRSPKP